jgi:hypothetical protein
MHTLEISESERCGTGYLELIELFKYETHICEGTLAEIGCRIGESEAVERGWLRRVFGVGRFDTTWLVPAGDLLQALARARAGAVVAAWSNYRERIQEN